LFVCIACASCGGMSNPAATGAAADASQDSADAADSRTLGVVEGTPFVMRTAFSNFGTGAPGAYPYIYLFFVSQDIPLCGAPHQNSIVLSLFLYNTRDTTPLGPGVYPLWLGPDGGTDALAYLSVYGAACALQTWDGGSSAGSGTVTITGVGARITGSFDLVTSGVHLSGAFDAPTCVRDSGTVGDYCM
jgi:hypothetical protein